MGQRPYKTQEEHPGPVEAARWALTGARERQQRTCTCEVVIRQEKDKGLRTQVLTDRALRTIVSLTSGTRCEDNWPGSRSTRVLRVRVGCVEGKGSRDEVEELEVALIPLG